MPEEELPVQKFYRLVKEFHSRQINRRQFNAELPATVSGMQGLELDAALHSLFGDPRYSEVYSDVADVVAKHGDPKLAPVIAGLYDEVSQPNVMSAFTRALVNFGEPSTPKLLEALQSKDNDLDGLRFDQKLNVVRSLKDAKLSAFTPQSQAVLMKELARIAFDKSENDVVRAQSLETLRDITTYGNMHLLASSEVLGELAHRMPKTEGELEKMFPPSDKIMPQYFRHTISTLVADATKGAVIARKERPAEHADKVEAALQRFNKQWGITERKRETPVPSSVGGEPGDREQIEQKIEDALHTLFAQNAFSDLSQLGIEGLGELRRPSLRTMKTLLEQAENPRNMYPAADALVKLAPAIGKSPKMITFVSRKFVENVAADPFLSAHYGKLLSQAGEAGVNELYSIMTSPGNEKAARSAAQWLGHSDEGATKLFGLASIGTEPLLKARAAFGLGALNPLIAHKRKNSHITLLNRLASSSEEHPDVRTAAVQGLLGTGEKGVAKIKEMVERAPNPSGKLSAAQWLTQAPAGLDALAELLGHRDSTTRAAAAFAVSESPEILARILPKEKKTLVPDEKNEKAKKVQTTIESHPLYAALKARAEDSKEKEEVVLAAKTALARLRKVRRRPTFAPMFARTSSMLPPEPTQSAAEAQRARMLPTMVGAQKPRTPTASRSTQKRPRK